MSLTILAACTLLSRANQAQGLEGHVTYSTRAARAPVVLEQLASLSHVYLESSPQMENEVLILAVKDVPLSDVLTRIATVTSGTWKHEGDMVRLVPNQMVRAREEGDELAKRIAAFKSYIEERVTSEKDTEEQIAEADKQVSSAKPGVRNGAADAMQRDPVQMRRDLASSKLVTGLLQTIDPKLIAETPGRLVFSTEPGRKQLPFGPNAPTTINEFIQSHNSLVPKVHPNFDDQVAGLDPETAATVRKSLYKQVGPIGPIAKVLLINNQRGSTSNPQFQNFGANFYDSMGKVAFSIDSPPGTVTISVPLSGGISLEGDPPSAPPTPVAYLADSLLFLKTLDRARFTNTDSEILPELRRKLELPAVYDPLSYYQTDEVLAVAKSKKKPLVAEIPDNWAMSSNGEDLTPRTVADVEACVQGGELVTELKDGAFEVLRPALPARSRANRTNRLALAELVQAEQDKGAPDFDDMGAFISRSPKPQAESHFNDYLNLVAPTLGTFSANNDWLPVAFYASLSPGQREKAEKEFKIEIGSLTSKQKALMERIVYEDGEGISIFATEPNSSGQLDFSVMFHVNEDSDYRSEQTEVAPNGLPNDAEIEFSITKEPFALRVAHDGAARFGTMAVIDPQMIAQSRDQASRPRNEDTEYLPPIGTMRLGTRTSVELTIHIGPETELRRSAFGYRIPKDAKILTEKELPPEIEQMIQESQKWLKENRNQSATSTGQVIHP